MTSLQRLTTQKMGRNLVGSNIKYPVDVSRHRFCTGSKVLLLCLANSRSIKPASGKGFFCLVVRSLVFGSEASLDRSGPPHLFPETRGRRGLLTCLVERPCLPWMDGERERRSDRRRYENPYVYHSSYSGSEDRGTTSRTSSLCFARHEFRPEELRARRTEMIMHERKGTATNRFSARKRESNYSECDRVKPMCLSIPRLSNINFCIMQSTKRTETTNGMFGCSGSKCL
jgi:hypothetical protein